MVKKNKRGWVKILEAFISIVLLIGLLFIIINSKSLNLEEDKNIVEKESEILEAIQIESQYRNQIFSITDLPINSTNSSFPSNITDYLSSTSPAGYNCVLKICFPNNNCEVEDNLKKSIYVRDTIVFSNKEIYSPRILKIYCY